MKPTLDEQLNGIRRRLHIWQTGMKIRHTERWINELNDVYAIATECKFCNGTGVAHFCILGFGLCDSKDVIECLHPTPVEAKEFHELCTEANQLLFASLGFKRSTAS